jgi:hypothetical protein
MKLITDVRSTPVQNRAAQRIDVNILFAGKLMMPAHCLANHCDRHNVEYFEKTCGMGKLQT